MKPVSDNAVTHSVWNPRTLRWDYYRAMGGAKLRYGIFAPTAQVPADSIGTPIDQAARPLPLGAAKVGDGEVARGLVAGRPSLTGFIDSYAGKAAVAGLAALGLYSLWKGR